MGQALERFCADIEALRNSVEAPNIDRIVFEARTLDDAVREVRELQALPASFEMELNRCAFEIQILQITQGALKMEIDRLREEPSAVAPRVSATGALLTFNVDGSVELSAESVQITGDLAVPA